MQVAMLNTEYFLKYRAVTPENLIFQQFRKIDHNSRSFQYVKTQFLHSKGQDLNISRDT
jgi:hypothetical protein